MSNTRNEGRTENPKSIDVKTVEKNLTLGAGDSYMLHPGATEESERAKREYEAEKQAEQEKAKASDRKPTDQFRSSTSEVGVRALNVDNKEDDQNKNSKKSK